MTLSQWFCSWCAVKPWVAEHVRVATCRLLAVHETISWQLLLIFLWSFEAWRLKFGFSWASTLRVIISAAWKRGHLQNTQYQRPQTRCWYSISMGAILPLTLSSEDWGWQKVINEGSFTPMSIALIKSTAQMHSWVQQPFPPALSMLSCSIIPSGFTIHSVLGFFLLFAKREQVTHWWLHTDPCRHKRVLYLLCTWQ